MQLFLLTSLLICTVATQQYEPYQMQYGQPQYQIPSPQNQQPMRFSQYRPSTNNGYNSNSYGQQLSYNQPGFNQGYTTTPNYNTQYGAYSTPYGMPRQFDASNGRFFNGVSTVSSMLTLVTTALIFTL
uniref:Uncharacterized protein n=1 Tax=Heterorhabditis bacteriophora TaxID=37862 RepID=A0A1I7XKP9_HETBA